VGTPIGDDSDRPLDTTLADMANTPTLVASRLGSLGWQHTLELSDENDNVIEERHH
jgi:hypothetical protein